MRRMCANATDKDRGDFDAAGVEMSMEDAYLEAMRLDEAYIATMDGEPVALYGIARTALLGRKGTPWMLSTPMLERRDVMRMMIKYGRQELARIAKGYTYLSGLKRADATVETRWLKWMGFSVGDAMIEINGNDFVTVTMDLEN